MMVLTQIFVWTTFALLGVFGKSVPPKADTFQTFTNPIKGTGISSPRVYLHTDDLYYHAIPTPSKMSIEVLQSPQFTDWTLANGTIVFDVSEPYNRISCTEIRFLRGEWYIYFHMRMDDATTTWRNYVIKSNGGPFGPYDHAIKLSPHDVDVEAFDATVLDHHDGQLYLIWSGNTNTNTGPKSIYIAPMFSPTEISGPRVLLRQPTRPWESVGGAELRCPQVIRRGQRLFLVFSASFTGNSSNCVGIIGLDYKRHPLVPENWWQNVDECVFWRNDGQNVFAPGIISFTTSPDRFESWMLYQASNDASTIVRTVRAEQFDWDDNGMPVFPRPAGYAISHALPAGQIP